MDKFYSQMKEVLKENKLEEYFDTELLEDIKSYVTFLDEIPDENIDKIAARLTELIIRYISDHAPLTNELSPKDNSKGKASRIINTDKKNLKKAVSKIETLVGYPINISDEAKHTLNYLNKLIRELETREFKEINRHLYYQYKEITKADIRSYLTEISKLYSIKNSYNHIEQLLPIIYKY